MLKRRDTTNTCSECLPDASGPLAITMPSGSITTANSSLVKMLEKQQKQAETKLKPCGECRKAIYVLYYQNIAIHMV